MQAKADNGVKIINLRVEKQKLCRNPVMGKIHISLGGAWVLLRKNGGLAEERTKDQQPTKIPQNKKLLKQLPNISIEEIFDRFYFLC